MPVLVTGGAGYIGSHTLHALRSHGYEPVVYDNLSTGYAQLAASFELIVGDLADSAKLAPILDRVEAVLHFAAHAYVGESVTNPQKYFRNNVCDALTLLDAVLRSPVRKFVFSSTCAVYGPPPGSPIREDTPCHPINPYGETKLAFENALRAYDRAYGIRFMALRYFNAAGADEQGRVGEMHAPEVHLIPCVFEALRGERDVLEVFGDDYPTPDGTCIRDYIHVSDLAEAHVLALKHLDRGVSAAINLGTGRGHSVREVIATVERVTGRKVPIKIAPRRAGDPPELVADPARAQQLLNWKAKRSLEEMVSTAWRWAQRAS